jgi:hypothetical protein
LPFASLPRESVDNQLYLGRSDALPPNAPQNNFERVAPANFAGFRPRERGGGHEQRHDSVKQNFLLWGCEIPALTFQEDC